MHLDRVYHGADAVDKILDAWSVGGARKGVPMIKVNGRVSTPGSWWDEYPPTLTPSRYPHITSAELDCSPADFDVPDYPPARLDFPACPPAERDSPE